MFSIDLIPLPVKIVVISTLVLFAAFFGYMKGKEGSKVALANYKATAEKQISDLKDMNARIAGKITVQYVDRLNTIREKETRYVERATNDVPSQFELSNGWVYTHDISATGGDAESTRSSDASPSGIKDNEGLVTIIRNYSTCESNAEQLRNLQQWIRDNQAAIEEANKKKNKKGLF